MLTRTMMISCRYYMIWIESGTQHNIQLPTFMNKNSFDE